jgi:TfoX/Sxy family transcriptional regulator of competence genes
MATQQRTVDFILEQLAGAGDISARKMFGEYSLYSQGKVVALICDDRLFVKPTKSGRTYIGEPVEAPPYSGAKPSFLIAEERWDDADWLVELIKLTAAELPLPKPKKK